MPIPDFEKDMSYLGDALELTRAALPSEKGLNWIRWGTLYSCLLCP